MLEIQIGNKKEHGFTLIELMVVVTIIAILVAIAVPTFVNATSNAKVKTCLGSLRTIDGAIQVYLTAHDIYAPSLDELVSGGVLKEIPQEPTGGTYSLTADYHNAVCSQGHSY